MPRDWTDVFITGDGTSVPVAAEPEPEKRRGFFRRLRENLSKTRQALGAEIQATLFEGTLDESTWERLEEALIMSLIERAEKQFEEDEAKELERKLRRNEFTLEDFLKQLKTLRKMGPLQSILGMLPGLSGHQLSQMKVDEREIDRVEAIVLSMTPEERRRPELIKGSRRLRIAKGSGTSVQQVNQLVKQFDQMRKLMRQIGRGKMPDLGALMRQAR